MTAQNSIDELSFTRRVSTTLAGVTDYDEAAGNLATAVLSLDGVHGIEFHASGEALGWKFTGDAHECDVLSTEVRSGETFWGSLELSHRGLQNERRFTALAKYAAQQFALALRRISLGRRSAQLRLELNTTEQEVRFRKLMHRARGIVAAQYGISAENAERLLRRHARNSSRTPLEIAEAVITTAKLAANEQLRVRKLA